MTSVRAFAAIFALALLVLIVYAARSADFWASFSMLASDPWGLVALADLYLGFFLFAAVIWTFEESRGSAIAWSVALFVLGNPVAALWLIAKLPELRAALRG